MNDCVFFTMPVPQSHHRDIHSPPQVSERLHRHPGSRSGEFRGTLLSHPSLTVVSELHTQRDVVFSRVKAPQASALHFGVCEDLLELCTEATVG